METCLSRPALIALSEAAELVHVSQETTDLLGERAYGTLNYIVPLAVAFHLYHLSSL